VQAWLSTQPRPDHHPETPTILLEDGPAWPNPKLHGSRPAQMTLPETAAMMERMVRHAR
jgi:hypothetical protein